MTMPPRTASGHSRYFVVAPPALLAPLREELRHLGARRLQMLSGGILCEGDLALGYRLCLWSRLASRVLLALAEWPARDGDVLYQAARSFPWEAHLDAQRTFAIRFTGESAAFRHSHFGALRIKDALCDRLRECSGQRPSVDREQPDLRFSAFLRNNRVTLYLELSGEPLHRRGYRLAAGPAPLKETLACGVLALAGWGEQAQPGPLLDPMCGSGTLIIEGVMMALGLPPGLWRQRFGFERWLRHDPDLWQALRQQAEAVRERRLAVPAVLGWGYDHDAEVIRHARANAERLGMAGFFHFSEQALTQAGPPAGGAGLLVTNPPYGERLGSLTTVSASYRELGEVLRQRFGGWRFALITANADLAAETGLQPEQRHAVRNGAIDCEIWTLTVPAATAPATPVLDDARLAEWRTAFANRLKKNQQRLKPWLAGAGTNAWRVYDADIPEFAVAVDRYGDFWHVSEYAPPAQINTVHAAWRLQLVLDVLQAQPGTDPAHIVLKTRERQRGHRQYERMDSRLQSLIVQEGPARLIVNLSDYLDTGLFLDHRPLRRMVREQARGLRFLNLFCYTGAVTVQAALGGAASSLSVDLSNTYLDWAEQNFRLNGLDMDRHRLLRADCLQWLAGDTGVFDLILLDPPSFSNSKRMAGVLDVQRDHPQLIEAAMRALAPAGTLLFSTNRQRFRLDAGLAARYRVEEITDATLDPDFRRQPPIHRCWRIGHADAVAGRGESHGI